jgi:hypothetical protein
MGQQQGCGFRLLGSHVDEMHGLIVDLGYEVRNGVHPGLLRSPVELLPCGNHLPEVADRRPVIPTVVRCRNRIGGVGEPALQIVDRLLWNRNGEGTDGCGLTGRCCCCHAPTLWSI